MQDNDAPRRLLVVDDVEEILEIFRSLVKRLPVEVRLETISDPREAARLLEEGKFDAVFSDFRMRHLDGAALLVIARRTQPHANLALLTGFNELPEAKSQLEAARIDAYLKKPISTAALLQVLRAFLLDDAETLERCRAEARAQEQGLHGDAHST